MDYKYQIEKIAKSYDARRKKQYWQMTKRLYGGTDGAVEHISKSKDPNIYHGTRAGLVEQIGNDGLKAGPYTEFGKGVFFGDKQTSGYYSAPKLKMNGTEIHIGGIDLENQSKEEVLKHLKEKGYDNIEYSDGKRIRIARPSELKGTKKLYPDINKAMVFDIDKRGFRSVGSQLEGRTPMRPSSKKEARIAAIPKEQKLKELEDIWRNTFNRKEEAIKGDLNYFRDNDSLLDHTYFHETERKKLYDDYTPKNKKEFNQMKYYGQSRQGRIFDNGIAGKGNRNEFFFKQDKFDPDLLRELNGDKIKRKVVAEKPQLSSIAKKLGKKKIALGLGGAGSLALAGAGLYGIHKYKQKHERE